MPAIDGNPAPGYVLGNTTVDPKTVDVLGPEARSSGSTEALTEPVSVAGARQDVTETVTIGFLDPSLRLKTPRLASVTVQVMPGPVERPLRERAVHLRNLARGLKAQAMPNAVDVVLRGSREGVGRVDADEVVALTSTSRGSAPAQYALTVHVDSPPDAGVARIDPATVQVRISSGKKLTLPRLFGTDGVRGTAGEYPLDPPTVRRLGAALVRALPPAPARRGCWSAATRASRADGSKQSSPTARRGEGATVTSAGIVPTPAVAYLTRTRGLRRRRRDFRVAQSLRGQRHQGVLRPRREVHRARRARRSRRSSPIRRGTSAAASRRRCRAPISSAPISITCGPSSAEGARSAAFRLGDRLRQRRDDDRRAAAVPRASASTSR